MIKTKKSKIIISAITICSAMFIGTLVNESTYAADPTPQNQPNSAEVTTDEKTIAEFMDVAKAYLDSGRFEEAGKSYHDAGNKYLSDDHFEDAAKTFEKSAEAYHDAGIAFWERAGDRYEAAGDAFEKASNHAEAKVAYQKAGETYWEEATYVDVVPQLVSAFAEEAKAVYRESGLFKDLGTIYFRAGLAFWNAQNLDRAKKAYLKAAEEFRDGGCGAEADSALMVASKCEIKLD